MPVTIDELIELADYVSKCNGASETEQRRARQIAKQLKENSEWEAMYIRYLDNQLE